MDIQNGHKETMERLISALANGIDGILTYIKSVYYQFGSSTYKIICEDK
tara:strand:+ start:1057 stop:1203 length:147 start_codon:yes stop_codon:yes gene_type:complete